MELRFLCTTGLVALFAAGCGGSSTVALELTDAPPDMSVIAHAFVSLTGVEVHVVDKADKGEGDPTDGSIDDDDKWRIVTERAGTFDLLALQNDVTASLGELDLPDGKITQIRMFVDGEGDNRIVLINGEECALDLTKLDPKGIKINHPFKAIDVTPGETVRVVVDFDLKESLDLEAACSYRLKPVIKIKRAEHLEADEL